MLIDHSFLGIVKWWLAITISYCSRLKGFVLSQLKTPLPDEIIGENHIAEMLMKRYIGVLPALEYPKESEKILNRLT